MAINLTTLKTGVEKKAPRILIYGPEKIGKTTVAASAPNPVFFKIEDGQGNLDLTSWDIKSYEDVMEGLTTLATEKHDFQSVVIDSLDWLEPLVWRKLIETETTDEKGRAIHSIEDYGYGKGYKKVVPYWQEIIDAMNYLRNEKDMTIVLLAHSLIKKFDPPDSDSYDQYVIKLHEQASSKLIEFCDCVLFARHKVFVKEAPDSKVKGRKVAVGSDDREIITVKMPSSVGGNRYTLPPTFKLEDTWNVLAEHIPYFKALSA